VLPALPVIVGIAYAVAGAFGVAGVGAGGFTTVRVVRVLTDGGVWRGVAWTVATAGASTTLAAILAAILALSFRATGVVERIGRAATLLPFPIPHVVAAAGGVMLLGQSGVLSRAAAALGMVGTPSQFPALVLDRTGIGFALTLGWKETPFLAFFAITALATRGAALEEVARTLGAGSWQTLRRVVLPLLWRGMRPAAAAAAIFIAGSYEAAALLAPTDPLPLPIATYERYEAVDLTMRGDAYVLVLLGLALAALAVVAFEWGRAARELPDR
jgi:putative spermidine/putrescine transport system permease protein